MLKYQKRSGSHETRPRSVVSSYTLQTSFADDRPSPGVDEEAHDSQERGVALVSLPIHPPLCVCIVVA